MALSLTFQRVSFCRQAGGAHIALQLHPGQRYRLRNLQVLPFGRARRVEEVTNDWALACCRQTGSGGNSRNGVRQQVDLLRPPSEPACGARTLANAWLDTPNHAFTQV